MTMQEVTSLVARARAAQRVADSGDGNVADTTGQNHRKTLGQLRDLQGAIRSA